MTLTFFNRPIKIHVLVFCLLLCSTLLRVFVASRVEFGNDEVYYWLYSLYPDLSHFDHPPMVGFFIQFFTANLFIDNEWAIRLAAILPATFNMWLLYLFTSELKNKLAGLLAVLMYNASIYGLVISGTFILPDAPLVTCWLIGLYFFVKTIPLGPKNANPLHFLLACLFTGLAIYSKYQGLFLAFGVLLYAFLFHRSWFRTWWAYIGVLFPLTALFLIYWWNVQNDFSSFSFHNDRVSFWGHQINTDAFAREVLGQLVYNNPVVVVLIGGMLIAYLKNRWTFQQKVVRLFFCISLPLIIVVLYLSISRDTLPHWSGISYITLFPLTAIYIVDCQRGFKALAITVGVIFALLLLAVAVVNKGWGLPTDERSVQTLGKSDVTLDMFGWKQAGEKVATYLESQPELMTLPIVSNKWFPAAHMDYYIARPIGKKVYGLGVLKDIHKYHWINQSLPALGERLLYLTDSRNFQDPQLFASYGYDMVQLLQQIPIERKGQIVKYLFVYSLEQK